MQADNSEIINRLKEVLAKQHLATQTAQAEQTPRSVIDTHRNVSPTQSGADNGHDQRDAAETRSAGATHDANANAETHQQNQAAARTHERGAAQQMAQESDRHPQSTPRGQSASGEVDTHE